MRPISVRHKANDSVPNDVNKLDGKNAQRDGQEAKGEKLDGHERRRGDPARDQCRCVVLLELRRDLLDSITFNQAGNDKGGADEKGIEQDGIGHHMDHGSHRAMSSRRHCG